MPHQCTTCDRTFPDGSKEMLSGCPDCGGNKFQFKPTGASTDDQSSTMDNTPPSDDSSSPVDSSSAVKRTSSDKTASPDETVPADQTASSDTPSNSPTTDHADSSGDEPTADAAESSTANAAERSTVDAAERSTVDAAEPSSDADNSDGAAPDTEHVRERTDEDTAQASARSDVVSPNELDQASHDVGTDADVDPSGSDASDDPRPNIGELRDELNEQFESIRIVSPGKYELNLMELYDRQEYIISLQEDGRYVIEMPDAWGISDE